MRALGPLIAHRTARTVVVTAVAVLGLLGGATPVLAHIDPDPPEAPAGSEVSVGFTVEHGCDGSPTVGLDLRLPAGVATAVPEPPAGWTASVAGDVITFTGGPLPDDVEGTFRVRMTLPPTPGATIYFPFVQRCEVGEIRWIDVPDDGSTGEEPAPAMTLLEPVPTTPPPPTEPPTTTAPATTTAATTTTDRAVHDRRADHDDNGAGDDDHRTDHDRRDHHDRGAWRRFGGRQRARCR